MIELGTRRELFIDPLLVDQLDGLQRVMHHPVLANQAFTFDAPWEGSFSGYSTVLQDGDRTLLYYRGWMDVNNSQKCYALAQSHDGGKTFERVPVGEQSGDGPVTNIVHMVPFWDSFCPFIDTRPGCPADERFKGLANTKPGDGPRKLTPVCSADGLSWREIGGGPGITGGAFDSLNVGFWSESEGCYVSYYRTWSTATPEKLHSGYRSVSRATSPDMVNWSDGVPMTYGDTVQEELYTNNTQPYFRAPHIYLAFPKRFVKNRQTHSDEFATELGQLAPYHTEVSDGVIMSTRGGDQYDRSFMEAFLRPGRDPANWVSRSTMSTHGMLQTAPDEISLYYHLGYATSSPYLQRFTIRLDGFASLNAPYAGGSMTSPVISFTGSRLSLNMATSAPGQIAVELQTPEGAPIDGYSLADCDTVWGDYIDRGISWNGSTDLSGLAGQALRLHIRMQDADIYSLQFAD